MERCVSRRERTTGMKCEGCGVEFLPNRWWQRFHNKACQQKWNKDRYRGDKVEELKGNGAIHERQHDDAYREKWAARRAEWAEEDRQEQRSRPKLVRRI